MSWQFLLGVIAVPFISSFAIGLLLLLNSVQSRVAKPAPQPQPTLPIRQEGNDALVAEMAGLLRRHLDMLPKNYDAVPDWERLVEDTVRTLTRHKLAPIAKLAAERQCATTH
jgi:hypothetical protein